MRKLPITLMLVLGAAAVALMAGLSVNALRSVCPQPDSVPIVSITVDKKAAAQRLSEAVRLRTIAPEDPQHLDPRPLRELHRLLVDSYPNVHRTLRREVVNDNSLLYTWSGSADGRKPILMMAHLDVVPVEPGTEQAWTYPPFAGTIADGWVWGRGTLDDKASVLGLLEAVELLIAEGFRPARTVYLAFGHDEESRGREGAVKIVALLKSRNVALEYVLDEGLIVGDGLIPGVAEPVGLIGTAEKGWLTIELTAAGAGGHASMPPPQTAIGLLAAAIHKLETHPMPATIQEPTRSLFVCVGPKMSFIRRVVFSNLWLFEPLVLRQLTAAPSTNAAVRTTLAVTIIRGGTADNVLPTSATAVVNARIVPGETTDSVLERIRLIIGDEQILVKALKREEPIAPSPTGSTSFRALTRTVREIFPRAVVAPGLVLGRTDSAHFQDVTEATYRFLPVVLRREDLSRIHGTNERIAIDSYETLIKFYAQLIRNSAARQQPTTPATR